MPWSCYIVIMCTFAGFCFLSSKVLLSKHCSKQCAAGVMHTHLPSPCTPPLCLHVFPSLPLPYLTHLPDSGMYRDMCNNAQCHMPSYVNFYLCEVNKMHVNFNYTQVSSLETNVAQIGEKLASLIDIVSAKSDKDKGGRSKIKEVLPLVSQI